MRRPRVIFTKNWRCHSRKFVFIRGFASKKR